MVSATFPSSATTQGFAPIAPAGLPAAQRAELRARITADPAAYTLEARLAASETPVWRAGQLEPRAAMLRVFAVADGRGGWTMVPGGLTRVLSGREGSDHPWVSMRHGSASADTWVRTAGEVDATSLLSRPLTAADLRGAHWTVSSRSAENLFWLGRYTERAENSVRLARLTLEALANHARDGRGQRVLGLLDELSRRQGLVGEAVPAAAQAPRVFERALLQALGDARGSASLAWNLLSLQSCAGSLRERLPAEHWKLIHDMDDEFRAGLEGALERSGHGEPRAEVLAQLARTGMQLAAVTGAQTDRMTRDDGWRLLSVGRQTERLHFLAEALGLGFAQGLPQCDEGFALLLGLFDSTMTYRAKFQARREVPPLLHLLVMDTDNPRSLAWVARTLVGRFEKLARHDPDWAAETAANLPLPEGWDLDRLCRADADGGHSQLLGLLARCSEQAQALAVALDRRLFAHVGDGDKLVWQ